MSYSRDLARLARSGAPTVDTAQDLRDLVIYGGVPPKQVRTRGAVAPGDDGGGLWEPVDSGTPGTYTDNLGTVVVLTGGDGSLAWVRVGMAVTPQMFGAVADGITGTATAFQAALDAVAGTKYTLHVPRGEYRIQRSLKVGSNTHIHCEAGAVLIHGYSQNLAVNATLTNVDHVNGNENISITGVLTLKDPEYNPDALTWDGQQLGFVYVDNLYIEHVIVKDFRAWSTALNISNSYIGKFEVDNPQAGIDGKNGCDGLHITGGENITIGEIWGTTGDDIFALVPSDIAFAPGGDIKNVRVGSIHGLQTHGCNLVKIHIQDYEYNISDVYIGSVTGFAGSSAVDSGAGAVKIFSECANPAYVISDVTIENADVVCPGGNDASIPLIQVYGAANSRLKDITFSRIKAAFATTADQNVFRFSYIDGLIVKNADLSGGNNAMYGQQASDILVDSSILTPDSVSRALYLQTAISGMTVNNTVFKSRAASTGPIYFSGNDFVLQNCVLEASAGATGVVLHAAATGAVIKGNVAKYSDMGPWKSGGSGNIGFSNNYRMGVKYSGFSSVDDGAPVTITHGLDRSLYNVFLNTRNKEARCYTSGVTNNSFVVNAPAGSVGTTFFDWAIDEY